jgi:hypothetical protein
MDFQSLSDLALAKVSDETVSLPGLSFVPAESPVRVAIREAWDAVKSDNYDAFAEAFENAIEIRMIDKR